MEEHYLELLASLQRSKAEFKNLDPFYMNLQSGDTDVYNNICIVGGGLAGYFTGIALRKFFKIPVTIIESTKIPPIGVGEATTPALEDFLFRILELDKREFYDQVKPTWKFGIKFFWGLPGDYYFNYPFDSKDLVSAIVHNNDINMCSLNSLLMSNDSSFITEILTDKDSKYQSLSKSLKYALHIDNKSFLHYLREKAVSFGIEFVDDVIIDAILKPDKKEIDYLISENGEKYKFDFYVDCSGFKSLLLEQRMKSKYVSFNKSLFNDRAIVATVPHNDKIKCYTLAESMNSGWCWNIPLRHEDHRGYVYSSDYISDTEAHDEMLLKNPLMNNDSKIIYFKSGRHEEFISGNVVGIGNSYAFVEPLESTGVHMIIDEIVILISNFFNLKRNPTLVKLINKDVADHWDYLKNFLSIHFKYNKKFNTPYWKSSNSDIDSSGFDTFISLYNEIGFLSTQDTSVKNMLNHLVKDRLFNLDGIDHILLGQGIIPRDLKDIALENKDLWNNTVNDWKSILKYSVPLKRDMEIILKYPELI